MKNSTAKKRKQVPEGYNALEYYAGNEFLRLEEIEREEYLTVDYLSSILEANHYDSSIKIRWNIIFLR